ncbi:MAG: recombinase family protein [Akkermansiaceae bacterium]|jgi:DNA invertase Pin-like site-specific DNA recombinase|nr:recombinase family protein [Akkermansiaceae bacterium]
MDTTPRPAVPVAILVRVSTKRQETERQVHELRAVAEVRGWSVVEVVEEDGVSGAAKDADRHGLARVEALAAAGAIRKVLVHEVSRVGRRPAVVHGFVERLLDLKVSLYWNSQNVETMLDGGKRNPSAGMMLAVLAEMALAERETLRERVLSGLDAARRAGKVLGRPMGTTVPPEQLLAKHADVVRLLRAGKSLRDVAARTRKGASTVKRLKALLRASDRSA